MTSSDSTKPNTQTQTPSEKPASCVPDWETIDLPSDDVLSHLTDAHVHPTDPSPPFSAYDAVKLGCLAAMSTYDDQDDVKAVSGRKDILPCFGYHPWFVHRYYVSDPGQPPPTKMEHYTAVLNPKKSKEVKQLEELLAQLPQPEPFQPLLEQMRANILETKGIVGEIGLDGTARVRIWPQRGSGEKPTFTPFRTSMAHQLVLCQLQLELADELRVATSFHCVNASGATMDILRTHKGNVDVHSCGGMSPDFIGQLFRALPNIYFSPSVLITARFGDDVVRAVPRERMLVESDTHDLKDVDRLVWAATTWISRCRGWRLETDKVDSQDEEQEVFDDKGRVRELKDDEVWTVQTLERNWKRFLGR